MRPVKIFVSYSHKDTAFHERLETHMRPAVRDGVISSWSDRCLMPGDDWKGEISRNLESADIIIALASANLFASDYCFDVEMKLALERHGKTATVIPILIRQVSRFGTSIFGNIESLPKDGSARLKPVDKWKNQDEAWSVVTERILDIAEGIRARAEAPRNRGSSSLPLIRRPTLEQRLINILERERRLLLLAPKKGGGRTLVEQIAQSAGYTPDQITRLSPFDFSDCPADQYFAMLTHDPSVKDAFQYALWQKRRANGDRHLIVLTNDLGDRSHLEGLAAALRTVFEEQPSIAVIATGHERAADLRVQNVRHSLFSGMPVEHIPELTAAEVATILTEAGRPHCDPVGLHGACGGHPGFLTAVLTADPPITTEGSASTYLATHALIRMSLIRRLNADDSAGAKGMRSRAREVLKALTEGRKVQRLADIEDDLRWAEVRLYYDGIIRKAPDGASEIRCKAVERAVLAEFQG